MRALPTFENSKELAKKDPIFGIHTAITITSSSPITFDAVVTVD
jgi:hypothetical protein